MAQTETDLLRDPVGMAQLRYREQIDAFKEQFIPKPPRNALSKYANEAGLRVDVLRGK